MSEDKKMEQKLDDKKKEMSTNFDTTPHLVIDLGNAFTKIGFAGNDLPSIIIPSLHAKNINTDSEKKNDVLFEQKLNIYGYEALEKKYESEYEINELTPGDHTEKTSEEFIDFLKEILEKQMQITPSDYSVIVNMSPIIDSGNVNTYLKMFFDELSFKSMAIVNNASLSLFSTGRTCGLVGQCGETRTYSVPIYEGFPLRHALYKNRIGGKHLTQIFQQWVMRLPDTIENYEEPFPLDIRDIKIIREIKEKTCSVPWEKPYENYLNSDEDLLKNPEKKLYKLPDDKTIVTVPKSVRLFASELLFNPFLQNVYDEDDNTVPILVNPCLKVSVPTSKQFKGDEDPNRKDPYRQRGLSELLFDSLNNAPLGNKEFKSILNSNIVLGGGTTMIENMSLRIKSDLIKLNEEYLSQHQDQFLDLPPPTIISENSRYISKWVGMSMIASMSAFDKLFVEKTKYGEFGEDRSHIMAKIF